jgi:glycosyltransferase involved in cell wall biosynthesis
MRIGILAAISWRVPPAGYGGWEQVAADLAAGLVANGHEVTVFASADSRPAGTLRSVVKHALSEDPTLAVDARAWETLHTAHAFSQAAGFDVLHNHAGAYPVCFAPLSPVAVVTTLHGSGAESDSRLIYRRHATLPYVSISNAERQLCPDLRYVATVYNGVSVDSFPYADRPDDYVLYLGRMSPDKGVHHTLEAARRAGARLILAGIVADEDRDYWESLVRPQLNSSAEYIGPVSAEEKRPLLASARALLHLVDYEEAFGLSMVEAMACGTPVIATRRGAIPELVVEGVSGFVVGDAAAAVAALERVADVDRAHCRQYARRFDTAAMVAGYERVYEEVVERRSPASP